jgi:hypothetical protein
VLLCRYTLTFRRNIIQRWRRREYVRFLALTAASKMSSRILRHVPGRNWRCTGAYCLHPQGVPDDGSNKHLLSSTRLHGALFMKKAIWRVFLRNIGIYKVHTASLPRRPTSTSSPTRQPKIKCMVSCDVILNSFMVCRHTCMEKAENVQWRWIIPRFY